MKYSKRKILSSILLVCFTWHSLACSILYYVDKEAGKVYAVNSEDFWLDTGAYIQIEKASKTKLARLWYGWDDFAQGGINSAVLFLT